MSQASELTPAEIASVIFGARLRPMRDDEFLKFVESEELGMSTWGRYFWGEIWSEAAQKKDLFDDFGDV